MLLAILFIVVKGVEVWQELRYSLSSGSIAVLIGGALVNSGLVLLVASVYRWIVFLFSGKTGPRLSISAYCKANLFKYIPGNVFHYVGRNQIAFNDGLAQGPVISGSLFEITTVVLAALAVSATFAGGSVLRWIENINLALWIGVAAAVMVAAVAIIRMIPGASLFLRDSLGRVVRQTKQVGIRAFLLSIGVYAFTNIINGILFAMLLAGAGYEIQATEVMAIIGANTFASLIGFLTPGAPAGLGIREITMFALLSGSVANQTVLTAVLLYRAVTIAGDILAYVFCLLFKKRYA